MMVMMLSPSSSSGMKKSARMLVYLCCVMIFFVIDRFEWLPSTNPSSSSSTYLAFVDAAQPAICQHLVSKRPQCFDEVFESSRNSVPMAIQSLLGLRNKITLEAVWWETQAMQTFALEILLREKLGYEVEITEYTDWLGCIEFATYAEDNGLLNGPYPTTALQYINLLLGKKSFDVELWTQSGKSARDEITDAVTLSNPAKVSFDGNLGPSARNGWFINADALNGTYFDTLSLIKANGGFNISSPVSLMRSSELKLSSDFPKEVDPGPWKTNFCKGENRTSFQGGTLDCVFWTWESPTANCCTRRMMNESKCEGLEECFALVVESPGWLTATEKNELRVIASAAPLEIVYAGPLGTKKVVKIAEDANKPVLFYWWEPELFIQPYTNDAGVVDNYRFARVNMLDEMYCANNQFVESSYRSSYSTAFSQNHTSSPCDFAKDVLEKASYLPDRLYFQDAFYLFSKFHVSFTEVWSLVNQTQNSSLIAKRDAIKNEWVDVGEDARIDTDLSLLYSLGACEWLKQNEHIWINYIEPNTYIFDSIEKIMIALFVFLAYVIFQMCLIYRRGQYYDVEVKRSLEVIEAHEMEAYTAGKPKILESINMSMKPVAATTLNSVDFVVKEISCRSDEKYVEFSITSKCALSKVYMQVKSGPHRSDVPGTWGTVPHAKVGKDFALPYFMDGLKATIAIVNESTVKFPLSAGTTKMRIPLLEISKVYSPIKTFHLILQPGGVHETPNDASELQSSKSLSRSLSTTSSKFEKKKSDIIYDADAAVFSSSIGVLEVCIYPSRPFMDGSFSTGLDKPGKGIFWVYQSLFVLIKNCLSLDYILSMQLKYQFVQATIAFLDTFMWGLLFQLLLDEGLILKKSDYCIFIGMAYAFIEVYKFHVGLHYFPGSYMIKTHFEQLLLLKYNLLSTSDLTRIKDSEPYFRVTVFTDCEALRVEFWRPINEICEQIFRMIGASAFLGFLFRANLDMLFMKLIYAIPFGFLGLSTIFLLFRCTRGLKIGLDEDKLEVIVFSGAHVILHNSLLLRELKSVVDFCSLQYDRLWFQLNGGIFERWYHLYYNTWMMKSCLVIITAVFYALPTKFLKDYAGDEGKVTVGEYLVSFTAMIQLLTGCVQIFVCSSSVLEVISKVEHIADLLNFKSSEEKRIENIPMTKDGARDHERALVVSSEVDFVMEFETVSLEYNTKTIFNECNIIDRSNKKISQISKGGIIGVLRNSTGSSKGLLNLICKEDISLSGKFGTVPMVFVARVNAERNTLISNASLRSNLMCKAEARLRDFAEHSEESFAYIELLRSYDSRKLWEICNFVGLSSSVTGDSFDSKWTETCLDDIQSLLDDNDIIKIRLVRALLALPELLVLDEVGDAMSPVEVAQIIKVLRLYLDFSIPNIDDSKACALMKKVRHTQRTIVWSGFERTLRPNLDAKDRMLVVQDSSKITLSTPETAAWSL